VVDQDLRFLPDGCCAINTVPVLGAEGNALAVPLEALLPVVGPGGRVNTGTLRVLRIVAREQDGLAADITEIGDVTVKAPQTGSVNELVDLVGELGVRLLLLLDADNDSLARVLAKEALDPLDLLLECRVLGLDAVVCCGSV
jgi:hypothetical protein